MRRSASIDGRPLGTSVLALAASVAILSGAIVATAQAQEDPYATVEEQARTSDLDSELTPVAKESDLWTLLHGAPYPKTETVEGSLTSFDTELFAVSFHNTTIGLAGGSACAVEPVQQRGEDDSEFGTRAANCEGTGGTTVPRIPVLYRYHEPADEDPGWDALELPRADEEGFDDSGYVGAIAWIDSNRALIVGGTGEFPRREEPYDGKQVTDPAKADVAGEARAWVYTRASSSAPERVEELDLSALTPATQVSGEDRAGMRGLSSLDCYHDPKPGVRIGQHPGGFLAPLPDPDPDIKLCFAGALGQIWEYRDDRFTGKRVDALSPSVELASPELFAYRVRDIALSEQEPPTAIAVTSGCCGPSEPDNMSRTLVYEHDPNPAKGNSWNSPTYQPHPPRWYAGVNDRPDHPDSYYSLTMFSNGGSFSVVATPGGPERPGEPPSVISDTSAFSTSSPGDSHAEAKVRSARASLGTARLLSGSGDVAGTDPNRPVIQPASVGLPLGVRAPRPRPDGEPDWVVGELRSTRRSGLGARGLVVATALPPGALTFVNGVGANPITGNYTVTRTPSTAELASGEYEPIDQEKLEAYRRSSHYLLPSYTANQVEIVGDQEDGWAVGDHGAILRLSSRHVQAAAGASEPKPPKLGAPTARPLADRSAYEAHSPPLPEAAGTVPAVGGETTSTDEPRMVPAGSVGTIGVDRIVMSRDGSEGWAIGSSGGATFSHYDGVSWRPCDPVGITGVSEPDPACAGVAALRGFRDGGTISTINLDFVTRVPLENDSDPTNDDELEIIAIGNANYSGPEYGGRTLRAVVRYSEGRWRFADPKLAEGMPTSQITDVAFTAPDDGWLAAAQPAGGLRFHHFNGEQWTDCTAAPASCGNSERVLPDHVGELRGFAVAGERIYLYGGRRCGSECNNVPLIDVFAFAGVPLILYRDPGGSWTDGSGAGGDNGGFDPAGPDGTSEQAGYVSSLAIAQNSAGGFEGWATGPFSVGAQLPAGQAGTQALLRLDPERGWGPPDRSGALEDYMLDRALDRAAWTNPGLQVAYPAEVSPDGAFIGQREATVGTGGNRIFGYDSRRGHFELLQTARPQGNPAFGRLGEASPAGPLRAMAPDGSGGFWAAAADYMFHYTDRLPAPVFEEAANPLGRDGARIRDLDGGADGSVWVATDSNRLYRHDRVSGWEETRVPGWDPGRVVTRPSQASAIAIGPGGEGLVVGEAGRIANLSSERISLDPAAGRSCALGEAPPCSTSRDLRAVDVAPDGSAIAGGDRLALLWRPAGGKFQRITAPSIGSSTTITALAMPTPSVAYLATDRGIVFRGEMPSAGQWTWRIDNARADGTPIALDPQGQGIPVRDLAVDSQGRGYAVGEDGLVMRRSEGAWRRLAPPTADDLSAVELQPGGGDGVLIGGEHGLVLTSAAGELRQASFGDFPAGSRGAVAGIAYLPGSSEGSVDAWVGVGPFGNGVDRLLRYRSDPADSRLEPRASVRPLPDAPARQTGELELAAFGKSDCDLTEQQLCPEMMATTTTNEVVSQRIADELVTSREAGGVDLALLSGDATDAAGLPASSLGDYDRVGSIVTPPRTAMTGQLKHRRYSELVGNRLADQGVPLLGAIGGQDLTETFVCGAKGGDGGCSMTKHLASGGENLAWREAFAGRADPWGDGSDIIGDTEGEVSFAAAPGSEDNSLRVEDQRADIDGDGPVPEAKAEIGGASTHYAVDAIRDGEAIARIVFVDTSLRSLASSDPLQQPHELAGGQQRFLERMICRQGDATTTAIDECTRGPDQKAIVVSNTPTYSYGSGALTHTALDATTFEATMLRYDVDLVISGALGYNGLYYTLAPGVHEPCAAGEYPEAPPSGNTPDCLAGPTGLAEEVEKRLRESPAGESAPEGISDPASLISQQGLSGAYPTLIAAGAGGKFGPDGNEPADGPAGQWHGYSLARLLPDGDLVVEQRPILDWIGLDAPDHAVSPKSRLALNGYGRSPLSTGMASEETGSRSGAGVGLHYAITTPAITHRYDLLLADPDEPWLPCEESDIGCQELHANLSSQGEAREENPCSPYLCLPSRIGVVDDQSGLMRAGDGKYPETFAIAMLSVDEEVATYPLVFKRSPAFVTRPAVRSAPAIERAGTRPTAPPPPPPPPGLPQIPQVDIPQIPPPPGIPQLTAAAPPELQPPAPPAPPPPSQQPTPLDLSVAPPGVSISTPTALIQPPTPPVNPAPPGGARREARQRQAAAQKGGADSSDDASSQASDGAGDLATGRDGMPGSQEMTRHDPGAARQENAYTRRAPDRPLVWAPTASSRQPSTWSSGLVWGGGLALASLALALSFTTLRPGTRRREPELPAPAFGRTRRSGR